MKLDFVVAFLLRLKWKPKGKFMGNWQNLDSREGFTRRADQTARPKRQNKIFRVHNLLFLLLKRMMLKSIRCIRDKKKWSWNFIWTNQTQNPAKKRVQKMAQNATICVRPKNSSFLKKKVSIWQLLHLTTLVVSLTRPIIHSRYTD